MRTAAHRESRDDEARAVTRAARHKIGAVKTPSGHRNAADPPRRHKTPPLLARESVVLKASRPAVGRRGRSSALVRVRTLIRGRIIPVNPRVHPDTVLLTAGRLVQRNAIPLAHMVARHVASPSHL